MPKKKTYKELQKLCRYQKKVIVVLRESDAHYSRKLAQLRKDIIIHRHTLLEVFDSFLDK